VRDPSLVVHEAYCRRQRQGQHDNGSKEPEQSGLAVNRPIDLVQTSTKAQKSKK
jgi:hypothetical protein